MSEKQVALTQSPCQCFFLVPLFHRLAVCLAVLASRGEQYGSFQGWKDTHTNSMCSLGCSNCEKGHGFEMFIIASERKVLNRTTDVRSSGSWEDAHRWKLKRAGAKFLVKRTTSSKTALSPKREFQKKILSQTFLFRLMHGTRVSFAVLDRVRIVIFQI